MNRLFLEGLGENYSISRSDRRYSHILRVLGKKVGDRIEAGRADGALGAAVLTSIGQETLDLRFEVSGQAALPLPVRLLMGFPRPIQAGRIIKDLTSLGVASIWFALSELGEKSYAESSFFKKGEFRAFLVEGAEQCGNPYLPEVRTFWSLKSALDALDALDSPEPIKAAPGTDSTSCVDSTSNIDTQKPRRICFHPGPALPSLSELPGLGLGLTLALGSERGWTANELELLALRGFIACGLGKRILKTETAAVAALSISLSLLGSM